MAATQKKSRVSGTSKKRSPKPKAEAKVEVKKTEEEKEQGLFSKIGDKVKSVDFKEAARSTVAYIGYAVGFVAAVGISLFAMSELAMIFGVGFWGLMGILAITAVVAYAIVKYTEPKEEEVKAQALA